jgi:hypothetical protein
MLIKRTNKGFLIPQHGKKIYSLYPGKMITAREKHSQKLPTGNH